MDVPRFTAEVEDDKPRFREHDEGEYVKHVDYAALDSFTNGLEKSIVEVLRLAGCRCSKPLIGNHPDHGPRCRLCNTCVGEHILTLRGEK